MIKQREAGRQSAPSVTVVNDLAGVGADLCTRKQCHKEQPVGLYKAVLR
ncbi:MAG: hypothetical protein Q4A34_00125 [Candidatus Saccharibacteria bacterium]|nr:hypothetical protein [Candidatus Saccharibacteria bacterium]